MTRWRTVRGGQAALLALLLAGAAAGCVADDPPEPTATPRTATATSDRPREPKPSPTPDVPQPTAPAAELVTLTEDGGIDGRHNVLTVLVDGRYTLQTRRGTTEGRLKAPDAERLRAALRAVRFNRIDASDQGTPYSGPDSLHTLLSYQDRTVVLGEGWKIPGMQAVLDALPPRTG